MAATLSWRHPKIPNGRWDTVDMDYGEKSDDAQTTRSLIQAIYRELKAAAAMKLRDGTSAESMTPTALVNEVYLRFAEELGEDATWQNRRHFFNAAARKMKFILIDRARRRKAAVHGGGWQRVDLNDAANIEGIPASGWSDLYEALERLEHMDAQAATVLRWRYLLQFSLPEIAESLAISESTAERAQRRGIRALRIQFESHRCVSGDSGHSS